MTANQSQENVTTTNTRVLVIGGSGKVASIAIPQYSNDYEITAMLRREEKAEEARDNGATPLVQDVTTLSADQWAALVRDFDVVVWTAGNGGRAGADVTYAVDRDAALECIKGLEQLQNEVGKDRAPRLIMVSYMGSLDNETDDQGAWLAYVESKKTVDKRLLDSDLNYIILAPTCWPWIRRRALPSAKTRQKTPGKKRPVSWSVRSSSSWLGGPSYQIRISLPSTMATIQ